MADDLSAGRKCQVLAPGGECIRAEVIESGDAVQHLPVVGDIGTDLNFVVRPNARDLILGCMLSVLIPLGKVTQGSRQVAERVSGRRWRRRLGLGRALI